jgi:secreted Zn-dependent insulinase-like peptidase
LPNNLQALLVSTGKAASDIEYDDDDGHHHHLDEDINSGASSSSPAQIEAAAVHVQAGHFDDTIPGLAHFHERTFVEDSGRRV